MARTFAYNLTIIFFNWKFAFVLIAEILGIYILHTYYPGLADSSYFSPTWDSSRPIVNPFFVTFLLGFIGFIVAYFITQIMSKRLYIIDKFHELASLSGLLVIRLYDLGYLDKYTSESSIGGYPLWILQTYTDSDRTVDRYYFEMRNEVVGWLDLNCSNSDNRNSAVIAHAARDIHERLSDIYLRADEIKRIEPRPIPDSLYTLIIVTIMFCVLGTSVILISMYGSVLGIILTVPVYVVFIGFFETARSYQPKLNKNAIDRNSLYKQLEDKIKSFYPQF